MDNNCEFASDCFVRNRRRLGQRLARDPKRKGELAELAFNQKATDLGLIVSKPCGDSFPYDFIVQSGARLLRIQVKSSFTSNRPGYAVCLKHRNSRPYTENDIDFVVVYIAPHDLWYILPVQVTAKLKNLRLYPAPSKRRDGGQYEKYREAWDLISGSGAAVSQQSEVPGAPGSPAGFAS